MCYCSCISSVLWNSTGRRSSWFWCNCRCWCSCRFCIRCVCTTLCNVDNIVYIMWLCHGNRRSGNRHICVQSYRNLKVRTTVIAYRLIFCAIYDKLCEFFTAELDRCVCFAIFYSNTLTGDLCFSCAAAEREIICFICTISHGRSICFCFSNAVL